VTDYKERWQEYFDEAVEELATRAGSSQAEIIRLYFDDLAKVADDHLADDEASMIDAIYDPRDVSILGGEPSL